ncbi:MAG: DNA primase [Bacteroidales bacterium]|nr:DNA primase [Bacteroidales bacterium]
MINRETIQRIMDATHVEEVVGEFVSLKKRGGNHIGCCPFHNEKTPSFYVSPSKGIFKCFGCGKSGNAVGFLMDHEHYTYPEALRYLAKKYNIEIEEEQMTDEQKERQTERDGLFHVSEFAQKYFADLLYNDELGKAIGLSYFHQRGLSDEIIKTFGLGYCLDQWSNFTDHARKNGYSNQALEKTGLTIFKEDGKCYDRFRGRVMFPIFSISGRVLGFSGRILSKEKQAAKYVNSPDSDIYNKSHILYGLFQAKNAISKADKCYLVEGNVDVVSMHQSGVCNTVASCGTSLTIEQIRLIKRYTPNVTVLYDGDSAGIKAALRAVNLLFEEGLHVRVVLFPDGEDPDSYAQKYGSTQLQEYLRTQEENFVKFKTRVLLDDVQNDPIRKTEVLKEIVNTIALVPDILERQEYITQTAGSLKMSEQVLTQELAKTLASNAQKAYKEELRRQQSDTQSQPLPQTPTPTNAPQPYGDDFPPPPEPEEGDYEPRTTYTAPPQVLPMQHPAESQERQIINLLVNYGGKELVTEFINDDGVTESAQMPAAEIIVGELNQDELTFDNPTYQTIFDIYTQAIEKGEALPDANFFAMHTDAIVRNTALSLMINSYSISKLWRENKNIYVPSIEHNLKPDIDQSINNFKLKKIEQKLEEISFQLRNCKDDDEITILMGQRVNLSKLRKSLCDALNRVT